MLIFQINTAAGIGSLLSPSPADAQEKKESAALSPVSFLWTFGQRPAIIRTDKKGR